MRAASLQHGAKVVGRYALFGEVAAGGMASVRIGRFIGPAGFTRTVAVKQLHPHFTKDPEFFAMFRDEAHLAARIRHGNVVPVLDVVAEGDQLLLVMEYIPGASLGRLLKLATERLERIPAPIAGAIMAGVLTGLHAAHEAKDETGQPLGVVHRDVSPQNILVGTDGIARVVDFGVAKAAGRLQTTRDGQLKGKMKYMAPEQLGGKAIDRRTDVYAASVVLWETLTGRPLFTGENDVEVFGRVLRGAGSNPSDHVRDLPAPFDTITMRGLCIDPDARFATARDMAQALAQETRLATPADVSDWVNALAAKELAERAAMVAEVESGATSSKESAVGTLAEEDLAPTTVLTPPAPFAPASGRARAAAPAAEAELAPIADLNVFADGRGTATNRFAAALKADKDPAPARRAKGGLRRLLIGVVALLALGGALIAYASLRPKPEEEIVAPATAVAPPALPTTQTSPPASEAPPAASSAAPPPAPSPVASAAPPAPTPEAPPPRGKQPPRPVPRPQTKPARNECDPPYYFDATGTKRYKRECG